MVSKQAAEQLNSLSQAQRERLFYIEVKAFFCGDLTRADIERRFGVRPAASARDISSYKSLAPNNLIYNAALRNYEPTDRFNPVFEHSAERVLAWFRDGYGDSLDLKIQRTVPCEAASDLVRPDLETLAVLTRAIAGRKQVKINYLSLTSGASTKTLSPLALADTGQRWHLRAYDCDRDLEDRVMCVECKYLHGLICRNWNKAGVAIKAEGAILPSSFTVLLQRCDGFKSAIYFAKL